MRISIQIANRRLHGLSAGIHHDVFHEDLNWEDFRQIFAIEILGEASGGIGLHLQNDIQIKNAELGYWLAEPYWGKGIITQAIMQIINYGFDTFEIDRIFARPFGPNLG